MRRLTSQRTRTQTPIQLPAASLASLLTAGRNGLRQLSCDEAFLARSTISSVKARYDLDFEFPVSSGHRLMLSTSRKMTPSDDFGTSWA